jgi:hypothetical protein
VDNGGADGSILKRRRPVLVYANVLYSLLRPEGNVLATNATVTY